VRYVALAWNWVTDHAFIGSASIPVLFTVMMFLIGFYWIADAIKEARLEAQRFRRAQPRSRLPR
jgi:hypothetical protein